MYLVDINGSGIELEAVDPDSAVGDPYEGALPDVDYVSLPNIPVERFCVLELPAQDGKWRQNSDLFPNRCAQFE